MPNRQKKSSLKQSSKLKSAETAVPAGRPNTKSTIFLQLLNREKGATVAELAKASDWQAHSVRGFMSGTLKKKRGLQIISQVIDGMRRYSIRLGSGGR